LQANLSLANTTHAKQKKYFFLLNIIGVAEDFLEFLQVGNPASEYRTR